MHTGARSVLAVATALLAACGNSGSSAAATAPRLDLLVLAAPDDDLASFAVGVAEVTLVTDDGARVAAFGQLGTTDLVAVEPLAEVLGSSRVPAARYRRAHVALDFAAGGARRADAAAATPVIDGAGRSLTGRVTVSVDFPTDARPTTRADDSLALTLDLTAAIEVEPDAVRFRPALAASLDPATGPTRCVRGSIESIDTAASTFAIRRAGDSLAVRVEPDTVLQIDGDAYVGTAGLAALAMLPSPVAVVARGAAGAGALRATTIEAGRGGPASGQDRVEGWIIGRDAGRGADAALIVHGSLHPAAGAPTHATTTIVDVDYATTRVLRDGNAEPGNSDALHVGQRIVAYGAFDGSTGRLDAGPAARGIVRMLPTALRGVAPRAFPGGVVELTLASIGPMAVERFDFAVEETPSIDPQQYRIDVDPAAHGPIAAGARLAVTGWVQALGSVGGVEFTATDIEDRRRDAAVWEIEWPARGPVAEPVVDRNGITVPLADATSARMRDGFDGRTLAAMPVPTIVPAAERGTWIIVRGNETVQHRDFADFAVHLSAWLTGGEHPLRIAAIGADDATAERIVAHSVTVVLR